MMRKVVSSQEAAQKRKADTFQEWVLPLENSRNGEPVPLSHCDLFINMSMFRPSPPVRFPLSSAHQSPTNGEHHASKFDRGKQEAG